MAASSPFLGSPHGTSLPRARKGRRRKPIDVVRTRLSVPQMVEDGKVRPNIQAEINRRVEAKLAKLLEWGGLTE